MINSTPQQFRDFRDLSTVLRSGVVTVEDDDCQVELWERAGCLYAYIRDDAEEHHRKCPVIIWLFDLRQSTPAAPHVAMKLNDDETFVNDVFWERCQEWLVTP